MTKDDSSLPVKDRQAILESYLVPGNIVKSDSLYVIVKIMPENEMRGKQLVVMNFDHPGDDEWEDFPVNEHVSFGRYSMYRVNAVYAPDYDEACKGRRFGLGMPAVIWAIRKKNKWLVWKRDGAKES